MCTTNEFNINNISRPYMQMQEWRLIPCHLSINHERRCKFYSIYLCICLLEREVLFSLQLCLYKNPCLFVIDSIASHCCYNVISVHLRSVKKSPCDHILWIVSLHICGDGLLIVTISLTLFLSPTGNSDEKVREYEFAAIHNGGILNVISATSMTLSFHL